MQEAMALSHESETIQIYSNSWGPPDSGSLVEGPGTLVQAVFMDIAQSVSYLQPYFQFIAPTNKL